MTPILSPAAHRLHHVAPWAAQRLHTWRQCTGPQGHPLDVREDRWAGVLALLRDDARWGVFEGAVHRQLRRVYDQQPERVRLDSTTAHGSWSVSEAGLFPCGHSKDHRPDWPQVKVLWAVLAPRGLLVATAVVPGQRSNDPLYVPAITRVRENLGWWGLLPVGDGKMGAVATRAFLQAGGDSYLGPASALQVPPPY